MNKQDPRLSGPYPGNVDVPMDLIVPEDAIAEIGEYGDIVIFPATNGISQAATARSGVPSSIHPEQKFRLVRPKPVGGE